ncbi:MAG: hypothetical protein V1908_04930 [Candidatus Peregrinibacteria bacterium]
MKPDKEPRRKGSVILGSALAAALAAWLAVKGEGEVPVVSKARDQAGHVIDGGVQRTAMVAAGRAKLREAGTFPPPEPLTVNSALSLAREGNLEAAQWLVKELRGKRTKLLESQKGWDKDDNEFDRKFRIALNEATNEDQKEKIMRKRKEEIERNKAERDDAHSEKEWESASQTIADQEGVSLEEWKTLEVAIEIGKNLEELNDFFEDVGADLNVNAQYGSTLRALIAAGELGAKNPLLARLLGVSGQGLKDLVQEAIGQNPLIPEGGRLSPEDIANLRAWYGLGEAQ